MSPHPSPAAALVESHENRLEHLENTQERLIVQSTEALLKIEHLSEKVEEGNRHLVEHLSCNFRELGEKVGEVSDTVKNMVPRLEGLEQDKVYRSKVVKVFRHIGVPVVIAGISVLTGRYAGNFWGTLVTLFGG
jgi:chromosome segregation ATPase